MFGLSRLSGFSATAPFEYFFNGLTRGGGGTLASRIIEHLGPESRVLVWLTPGLLLAAGLTGLTLLVRRVGTTRRAAAFLLSAGAIVIVAYAAITGSPFTFPKYQTIVAMPLALLAAMCFAPREVGPPLVDSRRRAGVLLVAGLIGVIPVSFLFGMAVSAEPPGGRDVATMTATTLGLAVLLAVGTTLYVWTVRGTPFFTSVAVARILPAIATAAIAGSATTTWGNATASYSTRYYFGERGLADVIDHLRNETPSDAYILAAKDIGLQSERRFFEDAFFLMKSPDELRKALRVLPVRYLVTRQKWDYSRAVFPEQFEVFPEFFEPLIDQPSPDFTIWARRDPAQA